MSRPKTNSHKFSITLPKGADALLGDLVRRKLFGESHSEVARYLIINALDELIQKGRLKEPE